MPEFPGGMQKMMNFLQENMTFPQRAKENGIQGKVYIKYIVNPKGKIEDVSIMRSSGSVLLDSEAIRVISIMPDWKPGKQNGKEVPVYFNLPISFKAETNISGTGGFYPSYKYIPPDIIFCDLYGNVIRSTDGKFQKLPEFSGGLDGLMEFVKASVQCDAQTIKNKKSSDVYIKFVIDASGEVSKPEVLISSGSDSLDMEAIRIAKTLPKWKPAIKEGQPVKTYCKMTINLNGYLNSNSSTKGIIKE
ncbi:MAG: energy transducer TonB [Bacteroidetes bacterium]|nr:energy transducer TonB [Bacteroidota bacterium]